MFLTSASNLVKWDKSDHASCPLCPGKQTHEHVLSAFKVAPSQGRFTWRHNVMLKELATVVDEVRQWANKSARPMADPVHFLKT